MSLTKTLQRKVTLYDKNIIQQKTLIGRLHQYFFLQTINEQIQNIAQKKDTLCRRMYN
mgnify:CR=1 FL=1